MTKVVANKLVDSVEKMKEKTPQRTVWLIERCGAENKLFPRSVKTKKFKLENKRFNDGPNSVEGKYKRDVNEASTKDDRNKNDRCAVKNIKQYSKQQKEIFKDRAKHYFEDDIIKWIPQNNPNKTQSENILDNAGNISRCRNDNQIKEFHIYIEKHKRNKKHRGDKKNLFVRNQLQKKTEKTKVTNHNQIYVIDSALIEDKAQLEQWIEKIESKRNYNKRNKQNRMSDLISKNPFSALADDDIEVETQSLVNTVIPDKANKKSDVILNIVTKENKNTVTIPTLVTPTSVSQNISINSSLQSAVTSLPKKSQAPPLPTVNNSIIKDTINAPDIKEDHLLWYQVGARQLIKEEKSIHEDYSTRFAPMYLPQEPNYTSDWKTEKPTSRILPITMRITAPSKYRVKNGRALVALLRGLQKVNEVS
jgi:hypothetical protein